jgi:hypothetical protein
LHELIHDMFGNRVPLLLGSPAFAPRKQRQRNRQPLQMILVAAGVASHVAAPTSITPSLPPGPAGPSIATTIDRIEEPLQERRRLAATRLSAFVDSH